MFGIVFFFSLPLEVKQSGKFSSHLPIPTEFGTCQEPKPNFHRHRIPKDISDLQHLTIARDSGYLLLALSSVGLEFCRAAFCPYGWLTADHSHFERSSVQIKTRKLFPLKDTTHCSQASAFWNTECAMSELSGSLQEDQIWCFALTFTDCLSKF